MGSNSPIGDGAHLQELDGRINLYRSQLVENPEDPRIHHYLGLALYARGEVEAAASSFRQVLDLNRNFPGTHVALAIALRDLGNLHEALVWAKRGVGFDASDESAHYCLGTIQFEMGTLDAAENSFRQVLELLPDHPDALAMISRIEN
ncbi:MAG: tetratricopeptide repeat protein [Armatimonadota bacterium]